MENQKNNNQPSEGAGQDNKEKKHSSAASIDNIISGATGNVKNRHSSDTWSNTGTNISYEGPTAPGGGGSVGTGYASGQDATGARISSSSGDDALGETKASDASAENTSAENILKPEDKDDDLDRDTLGTP